MSLKALAKFTKQQNEKFNKASKAEQRVMIAEDVIAALAFACGTRPANDRDRVSGDDCRTEVVDTGLVSLQEAFDLENAYEGDDETSVLGSGSGAASPRGQARRSAHPLSSVSNGVAPYTTVALPES